MKSVTATADSPLADQTRKLLEVSILCQHHRRKRFGSQGAVHHTQPGNKHYGQDQDFKKKYLDSPDGHNMTANSPTYHGTMYLAHCTVPVLYKKSEQWVLHCSL